MKLGYEKEVKKTLQYALNIYSKHRTLTTTITKDAKPLHMFEYSPDSLPMLLRSLRQAKAHDLAKTYEPFIEEQTRWYLNNVMDEKTNLVNNNKWSSMKDNFRRFSSCYDNSMLAMLSDELDILKLANPFKTFKIKQKMREALWSGQYFYDDSKKKRYISGDANTFPYWCGVFKDPKMFAKSLESIQKAGLDKPWPLKYTRVKMRSVFPMNILLPDYEQDTIWMHLGLCFLDVVKKHDEKLFMEYYHKYTELIEKHGTFLELYDKAGKPYKRRLYITDEGMIWAAKYLEWKSG